MSAAYQTPIVYCHCNVLYDSQGIQQFSNREREREIFITQWCSCNNTMNLNIVEKALEHLGNPVVMTLPKNYYTHEISMEIFESPF